MGWTPHDYGFNLEGGTTLGGRSQPGKSVPTEERENLMEEDKGDTDPEGSYIRLEEEHFT